MFVPTAIKKEAIIVRVMYWMKSSANAWRQHLPVILENELRIKQWYMDNNIWMRPGTKEN